jgi:hypothetical protein
LTTALGLFFGLMQGDNRRKNLISHWNRFFRL